MLVLSLCSLLYHLAPPTEAEVFQRFGQWRQATEVGDWQTVWTMLGPPSTMTEPHLWRPNYREDQSGFIHERQASYANMQRHVRLNVLRRMTHVDDHSTFIVDVDIDYTLPGSREIQTTNDLFFYLTKRDGRIGIWGFSTPVW